MENSIEQRRSKRVPVSLSLEVSSLFKQDNVKVSNINAPITVHNISKNGIGFSTESTLPIGYYFNARLEFSSKDESLNCVVCIVRRGKTGDGRQFYGCEFVGMSPVLDYIFEGIEQMAEKKH